MTSIQTPTNSLVEKYLAKFDDSKRYSDADKAIIKLFKAFPFNIDIEDILLKISVINDLYSTNVFGTYILASHIKKLEIDQALTHHDLSVVIKIATGHGIRKPKENGDRNFYSFATKYCNWHNKDAYLIYDSFIEKLLLLYRDTNQFSSFEKSDLKDYVKFKKIIITFRDFYQLTKHDLKDIDKFLWTYSKDIFPTNYKV
jgi:hypothetical protein